MERKSWYRVDLWAILILVLLNVSLLGLFWYEHFKEPPPRDEHSNPEEFFIRELGLDQAQADSVRALRREHFRLTDSIKAEMVHLNERLMEELFASSPDTAATRELARQIGLRQAEFDHLVYQHFSDVKAILRADQYPALHRLIFDALQKKLPHADDRPPRQDDDRRPPPRDARDHRGQ